MPDHPSYVYVASSWRNYMQVAVCAALRSVGIDHYDFKADGFSWKEVALPQPCTFEQYERGIAHPRAIEGFDRDMAALDKADCTILVMPCGRSAHLELGYAIGKGQRTAVLYEQEPFEPDLMHKAADFHTDALFDLLGWLGVED